MIQIIKGTYGHVAGDIVRPKTSKDGPFELTKEQEARLVREGVAVYVDAPDAPIGFDEQPEDDIARAEADPALDGMTAKELRELGKQYGLTFKVGMTKTEMIEAIKAEWTQDDEGDGEEPPAFDPTEAVEE